MRRRTLRAREPERERSSSQQPGRATPEPHAKEPGRNERVWSVVRRIPKGRVATYGQVARLAGLPGHARQVGYALHDLPSGSKVPWHRVINAQGRISERADGLCGADQRARLLTEGVWFDAGGRVDLELYGWRPRTTRFA